jgi:hypothetical protein
MMGRTCRESSCRSGRRPRQIHPVAAARCFEDSAVRGCLGSHRRGRLFLLVDGWLRLTARTRVAARLCERAYTRGLDANRVWLRGYIICAHCGGGRSLLPVSGQASSSQSGRGGVICASVSFVIRQWQRGKTEPAAPMAESGGSGEGRKSAKGTTRQQSPEIRE